MSITDSLSGAAATIELEHHKVHSGKFYTGTATGTIVASDYRTYAFRPSSSKMPVHFEGVISTTGPAIISLLESPTISTNTGETSVTMYNNYRTSSNTIGMTMASCNSSVVTAGTRLDVVIMGSSGSGPIRIGGESGQRNEFILDSTKTYVIKIDNQNGAATTNFSIGAYIYEGGADN